jgi:hypothetical protein
MRGAYAGCGVEEQNAMLEDSARQGRHCTRQGFHALHVRVVQKVWIISTPGTASIFFSVGQMDWPMAF